MHTQPRVLIVDDEAPLRRQLMVGLAQHGYEVEECEEGLPALAMIKTAKAKQHPFAFVILDVRLPDIDGLKILSVLKATYPDLPVVVITGYGNENTVNTVQSRERSGYLDKPFEMDSLISELDRMGTAPEEKPRPRIAPEARPLESAFIFIRGEKDADMYDVYSRLNFAEGVCYCDPVVGDWDMVLLIQASSRKEIDELVKRHVEPLKSVAASEVHQCEKPRISKEFEAFIQDYEKAQAMERAGEGEMDSRKTRLLTSYAVLDLDTSTFSNLYMKLYFTDNVVHCDVTDGGRQIILLLQGISTQEIQSVIRNQIRLMQGVLRIKQLNALNFSTK
jgi:CheY-like chemotaxis protein